MAKGRSLKVEIIRDEEPISIEDAIRQEIKRVRGISKPREAPHVCEL